MTQSAAREMTALFPPGRPGKIAVWLREVRLPFLVVTVLPAVFGALVAWSAHVPVNALNFVLALAGASLMHLGANVINDYFDYRNGTDAANREFVAGFTGGSRVIQDGLLSHREVLAGAAVLLAAAAAAVAVLYLKTGPALLIMGAAALLAAVTYSLFLHALVAGELMVGFCFGTLIPAGSFFAQAGYVTAEVLFASVPLGLGVFLILFINEMPDYAADRACGKRTLVVRLGRRRAARLYTATLIVGYVYTAVAAAAFRMPLLLGAFVTVPLAVAAAARLLKYNDMPAKLRQSVVGTIVIFTLNGLIFAAAFAARWAV